MKQDSWKKSLKMGAIAGAISFGVYMLLVLGTGFLTQWQSFFGADLTMQRSDAYSWEICAAVGVILSSLVPVCTLRYEKIKYIFLYIPISLLAFVWLYGVILAAWLTINPAWCPFTTLDALSYLMIAIPIGSVIGTLVAMGIHLLNKD